MKKVRKSVFPRGKRYPVRTREFDPAIKDRRIRDFYAVRSGAPQIRGNPAFLQQELLVMQGIRWDYECPFLAVINPLLARIFPRPVKGYQLPTPEKHYDSLGRRKTVEQSKRADGTDGKMSWDAIARISDAEEMHALRRHHVKYQIRWPTSGHAMFSAIINFRLANLPWPEETLYSLHLRHATRIAYQPPRSQSEHRIGSPGL